MKSVFLFTLGCRLNQAESAVLQSVLREKGFRVASRITDADIVVINSCTVTEAGDTDTRRLVNRVNRNNPSAQIAIIGCQAQVQKKALLQLPGIRWIIGTSEKMHLAEILSNEQSSNPTVLVPHIRRESFTMPVTKFASSRVRANLKIQDGCDNFCAYCEIPYARGRARSRIFSDILKEARALVNAGHREIVLTGINVGMYTCEDKSLIDVIDALQQINRLDRIRISSIEHTSLPLALAKFMLPRGKLCRFLHIPLQNGSDRILKRMGRGYTVKDYAYLVNSLVEHIPGIMIGSDIIVGFPGETEQDFHSTALILESLPVAYFHIFPYSNRYRARSRTFKGGVSILDINRRSAILRHLSIKKRIFFLKNQIGLVGQVLFEQKKNNYWIGHTDNYVTIKISSESDLRNRILDIRMVKLEGQSIIGSLDPCTIYG